MQHPNGQPGNGEDESPDAARDTLQDKIQDSRDSKPGGRSAWRRFLPLIVLLILMAVAYGTGVHEHISLQALKENREALLSLIDKYPLLSSLLYIGIYTAAVALSLPAASLLTMAGGFLFGLWLGTLYVVSAATLGATIIFLIARSSLGTTLREKAGSLYQRVEANMRENAVGYMLFMRLVPLFPFFLVNVVPALFNVKLRSYVLTTFFGIMPGSFVYVNLGQQLVEIDRMRDLVSGETLLAFGLLGLFALMPTLYRQWRQKVRGRKSAAVFLAFVLALAAGQPAYSRDFYPEFLNRYDGLLAEYTETAQRKGITYRGVDYDAWATDDRHDQALELLQKTDPGQFDTKTGRLAFWINTYNFLTIDLIVDTGERESIRNQGGLFASPWTKFNWAVAGKSYTLDQVEHDIIRAMGEPRIHFAINCAAISCPDLRGEAYRANMLDSQLQDQTIKTLNNPAKGLERQDRVVRVSKIFKWFREDFRDGNIRTWLQQYVEIDPDKPIAFMQYDWSLNRLPEGK